MIELMAALLLLFLLCLLNPKDKSKEIAYGVDFDNIDNGSSAIIIENNKEVKCLPIDENTANNLYESRIERSPSELRPQNFTDYIGQKSAKKLLTIAIGSSIIRQTAIDHILLTSRSAGMGKTTLAMIIANMRAVPIKVVTATNLSNANQVFELIGSVSKNQIVFIDEIHRLPVELAEILYLPMEDFVLDDGSRQIQLPPFTLIGATAGEEGLLPKPFLDRFGIKIPLEDYTLSDICHILKNSCNKIQVNLDDKSIENVSRRSCYNPRISNMLLRRVRDYCVVNGTNNLNETELNSLFSDIGIDKYGLDGYGKLIIKSIFDSPKEAMGLTAIARVTGISSESISEKYEPVLVRLGFVSYSAKGRVLTQSGKNYILKDNESQAENECPSQEKIEIVEQSINNKGV